MSIAKCRIFCWCVLVDHEHGTAEEARVRLARCTPGTRQSCTQVRMCRRKAGGELTIQFGRLGRAIPHRDQFPRAAETYFRRGQEVQIELGKLSQPLFGSEGVRVA